MGIPWKTKSYCRQKYYMNNKSGAILCFYSVNEVMKFIGNNEREVTLRLNTFMFANVSS